MTHQERVRAMFFNDMVSRRMENRREQARGLHGNQGIPRPTPSTTQRQPMNTITKSTYAWLTRTHAFFAGLEYLTRHGYVDATRQ